MPYLTDLLQKKLMFDIKAVGMRWGVYEYVTKELVTLDVGCVFIGTVAQCRTYIQQRRSRQELKEEESRGRNPMIDYYDRKTAKRDGVIEWGD